MIKHFFRHIELVSPAQVGFVMIFALLMSRDNKLYNKLCGVGWLMPLLSYILSKANLLWCRNSPVLA